jgi:hypothetical protein
LRAARLGEATSSVETCHLPRERERARRREVDGGLDRGERLDVVLVERLRVEWRERVAAVRWTQTHSGHDPAVDGAVRPFHDRAGEDRRRSVERAREVRHLVLHAVGEGPAVTDDQRCAPRVRPEDVGKPAAAPVGVRARSGELAVLTRHHRKARAVRGRVPRRPGEAELERIARRLRDGAVELLLEVAE